MHLSSLPIRTVTAGALMATASAQGPVLETPGSATWETESIAGGTRTIFSIFEDTVFSWENLNLGEGSELVFDFIGGDSVLNELGGGRPHIIAGDVIGTGGSVGFFSPGADLFVTGNITANSVTVATLGVDPMDFADGGSLTMSGEDGGILTLDGSVEATAGDAVLAGKRVRLDTEASVFASGSAMIVGTEHASFSETGDRLVSEHSQTGFVSNAGVVDAARIEVAAGSEIDNRGTLGRGDARVFLEVGAGGKITNESTGIIVDGAVFQGLFSEEGGIIEPHEGDAAPVVGDATLKLPTLKRPDGSTVSESRTVTNSAPMSASADGARDRNRARDTEDVARRERDDRRERSLVSRTSFFGMRGGARESSER